MSIDASVEVLIKDRTEGLPDTLILDDMPITFLWGLRYVDVRPHNEAVSVIRLVYEGPMFYLRFFESPPFRKFHSLMLHYAPSLDYAFARFQSDPKKWAKRDYTSHLFGPKVLYKTFFDVINSGLTEGKINDGIYRDIVCRVNAKSRKLEDELEKVPKVFVLNRERIKREFRDIFRDDPLLKPYISEAENYLTDETLRLLKVL